MQTKIIDLIRYEPENSQLDFKRDQYDIGKVIKRHDIVKDIMAMANGSSNEDKFLIIGVKELHGSKQYFPVDKLIDDANYQRLVNDNVEPSVNFEYKPIEIDGLKLAYFRIFNNQDRPYLFKKDLFNFENKIEFRKGDGYIRKGTAAFKVGRQDLDLIYKNKAQGQDRKGDLKISYEVSQFYCDNKFYCYLNIIVQNKSNSSIKFDAELVIFKDTGIEVKSEVDIKRENLSDSSVNHIVPMTAFVQKKELYDAYIILTTYKDGIYIRQKDTHSDIFQKHTILIYKENRGLNAKLKLRSDDFTGGPLEYVIEEYPQFKEPRI